MTSDQVFRINGRGSFADSRSGRSRSRATVSAVLEMIANCCNSVCFSVVVAPFLVLFLRRAELAFHSPPVTGPQPQRETKVDEDTNHNDEDGELPSWINGGRFVVSKVVVGVAASHGDEIFFDAVFLRWIWAIFSG